MPSVPVLADAENGGASEVYGLHREAVGIDAAQEMVVQHPIERRRVPQFELPESTYAQADTEAGSADARRAGKLSLEQRRALRRQINEAGSDLYIRPH